MPSLVETISYIFSSSTHVVELEDRVEFLFPASAYKEEWKLLQGLLDNGALRVRIDDEPIESIEEVAQYRGQDNCRAQLNKDRVESFVDEPAIAAENILFLTEVGFEEWLESLPEPFNSSHPFYRGERVAIWLAFLTKPIPGEKLSILPCNFTGCAFADSQCDRLPSDSRVRSVVNFVTSESVRVDPSRFRLPFENLGNPYVNRILSWYSELLSCSLVKEFYGRRELIVSGVKRVGFVLSDENFLVTEELLMKLEAAVVWAYQAHPSTRLMLLMERLSLDLNPDKAILPSIVENLDKTLHQAKHKYEYVIKERQEEHAKEVSELQKNIKSSTDGFSAQAMGLISGTLRDSLYALVVIAIGLLARVIDNTNVLESAGFNLVFKALAIYLVISALARAFVGWKSLDLSKKDLYKWKDTVRNHLSQSEVNDQIQSLTSPYVSLFVWCGIVVVLLHVLLALFVWNIPILLDGGMFGVVDPQAPQVK